MGRESRAWLSGGAVVVAVVLPAVSTTRWFSVRVCGSRWLSHALRAGWQRFTCGNDPRVPRGMERMAAGDGPALQDPHRDRRRPAWYWRVPGHQEWVPDSAVGEGRASAADAAEAQQRRPGSRPRYWCV